MTDNFDFRKSAKIISQLILSDRAEEARHEADRLLNYLCSHRELDNELAGAHFLRGYASNEAGLYELAVPDFNEALTRSDDFGTAHCQRGIAYRKLGRIELAKADLAKAVQFSNERQPDEFFELAEIYMSELQFEEALALFEKGSEVFATLYGDFRKAEAMLELGRLDEVESAFRDFASESPQYLSTLRGWVRLVQSDFESSFHCFSEAVRGMREGSGAPAYYGLAWLSSTCPSSSVRDADLAMRNTAVVQELGTIERWETDRLVAAAHAASGDWNTAVAAQQQALEYCPIWIADHARSVLSQFREQKPLMSVGRGGRKWLPLPVA